MEVENFTNRIKICHELNRKLITRPGSLELIEKGVLEVDPELKHILKSGDVLFRRVSSDETDNSTSSPSHKILKHQEALDDETARRLSLAQQQRQQQPQINAEDTQKLLKISENESLNCKKLNSNKELSKPLVTGQISRFKGLVFHNYTPAGSFDNQEARIQQQEKLIQLQETGSSTTKSKKCLLKQNSTEQIPSILTSLPSQAVNTSCSTNTNTPSSSGCSGGGGSSVNNNKCSRCAHLPDRVLSLAELTVAQLKSECRQRNLSRAGNKQALIETLVDFTEEILARENACSHFIRLQQSNQYNNQQQPHIIKQLPSQQQIQRQVNLYSNSLNRPTLNDRSISLPLDYYDQQQHHHQSNHHAPPPTIDNPDNTNNQSFSQSVAMPTPLTLNLTCIGGSFSNLPITPYSIFISSNNNNNSNNPQLSGTHNLHRSPSISQHTSATITQQQSTASTNSIPGALQDQNTDQSTNEIQSTKVAPIISSASESSNQCNMQDMIQQQNQIFNPLLFYRLPSLDQASPDPGGLCQSSENTATDNSQNTFTNNYPSNAFIQTNGLEMIQLLQLELLRNIESESLSPAEVAPDSSTDIISPQHHHQRVVLLNFLRQLIQKTPAFANCPSLLNNQHKINNWLQNQQSQQQHIAISRDLSNNVTASSSHNEDYLYNYLISNTNKPSNPLTDCTNNGSYPSGPMLSQGYKTLHQSSSSTGDSSMSICNSRDNDLLSLINEVVNEASQQQQQHTASSSSIDTGSNNDVLMKSHSSNLLTDDPIKSPNSPMMIDAADNIPESPSSNCGEKRAAWLQKASPRLLYKQMQMNHHHSNSIGSSSNGSSNIFNWEFTGGSGGSQNSSSMSSTSMCTTDAQILSPDTERVLLATIFQQQNQMITFTAQPPSSSSSAAERCKEDALQMQHNDISDYDSSMGNYTQHQTQHPTT